jgi:Ulp1 protease family, C-terminal catalytic domain
MNSTGGQFLIEFQYFLATFCFYDLAYNDKLRSDQELILKYAVYAECPQQNNAYDCALFASAVVLHIAHGLPIVQDVFTKRHISNFRFGLYTQLSNPNGHAGPTLTSHLVCSFFPQLLNAPQVNASPALLSNGDTTILDGEIRRLDKHFNEIFVLKKRTYSNHEEIYHDVEKYHDISALHFAIRRCQRDGRTLSRDLQTRESDPRTCQLQDSIIRYINLLTPSLN